MQGSVSATINIAGRAIGQGHQPYVIAELSGNHNGDIERAFRQMWQSYAVTGVRPIE